MISLRMGFAQGYFLNLYFPDTTVEICKPASFTIDFSATSNDPHTGILFLSSPDLPAGASAGFTPNPLAADSLVPQQATFSVNVSTTPPGLYTVSVIALGIITKDSVAFTLIVRDAPPGATSLLSPADNATGLGTLPAMTWTAVNDAAGYHLQLATDNQMNNLVIDQAGIKGTAHNVTSALQTGTDYYWRVRSENACGTSGWTTARKFTTAGAVGWQTEKPANMSISIDESSITIVGIEEPGLLQIYSTSGAKIFEQLVSGRHECISIRELATGMYILAIQSGNRMETKRFSVK